MGDYAQVFTTQTPEQTLQWKKIAKSNPRRLSRALGLRPGQTTKEGDNASDIFPALDAVKDIMMKTQPGVENKEWVGLVNAGVVDALCKAVCGMVLFLEALPSMPHDLMNKVKKEIQSPFFAPLESLCDACSQLQYPPTQTDKKVIAAIRGKWPDMMDRLWHEPKKTLRPEESHTRERIAVSHMLLRIVFIYPSFMSVLYDPSDLTIQIIARHWKHAQKENDITATAAALSEVLNPSHPRITEYMSSHRLAPSSSGIVSKILAGLGPTTSSSKPQQAKILATKFAEHLVRLNIQGIGNQLEFLMNLVSAAEKGGSEPEIPKAFLKSAPLWNAVIRSLKKSAKPESTSEQGPDLPESPGAEKSHRVRVTANCMSTLAHALHTALFANPQECEHLVRIWANENLFGAIEDTIEILVTTPGMTMHLERIVRLIVSTSEQTPSLLHAFSPQFPRWRLFATLVKRDAERQQVTGRPDYPMPGQLPSPDSHFWDQCVWQTVATLQYRCMDKTVCSKRCCLNSAESVVCVCQLVKYCSETCKTKDAKEHQLACGLMHLLEDAGKKESSG